MGAGTKRLISLRTQVPQGWRVKPPLSCSCSGSHGLVVQTPEETYPDHCSAGRSVVEEGQPGSRGLGRGKEGRGVAVTVAPGGPPRPQPTPTLSPVCSEPLLPAGAREWGPVTHVWSALKMNSGARSLTATPSTQGSQPGLGLFWLCLASRGAACSQPTHMRIWARERSGERPGYSRS